MGPISLEPLVQTQFSHKKKPAHCAGFLVCGELGIHINSITHYPEKAYFIVKVSKIQLYIDFKYFFGIEVN
jgi:hypothetical protein